MAVASLDFYSGHVARQSDARAMELHRAILGGANDSSMMSELFALLRADFPTFCALMLKVRPKGGGRLSPFTFNQVQLRIWAEMVRLMQARKPLFLVILKFRQAGMSTFWDAWIFWQMWRQRDVQAMIVAHQIATAETMIETMRVFYDELPVWAKPELREGNHGATLPRGEVYFANQRAWCLIHQAKNVDPRGQQVTHVLETEFAMYPNAKELNGALLPQLPSIGSEEFLQASFVVESTPKGQNEFYELYQRGKDGKSFWTSLFVPWFIFDEQYSAPVPKGTKFDAEERSLQRYLTRVRERDYDGKPVTDEQMFWRQQIIDGYFEGDVDMFDQEYPSDDETCFLLASKSVFREHGRFLQACVREAQERAVDAWKRAENLSTSGPLRAKLILSEHTQNGFMRHDTAMVPNSHGQWLLWEPVERGHIYVVGADPAFGIDDADLSVAIVLDCTSGRQVGEFAAICSPKEFSDEIAAIGWYYNTALLVPEVNNVGYVVLKRLIADLCYPNLYRWPKFDEVNKYTAKRGWETNSRTKMLMIQTLRDYLGDEVIHIASKELLSELSTFEQKGDSFEAQSGRHDDRVMALGLACMGIAQTPKLATALLAAQSKLPTAAELGLVSSTPQSTPMPKAMKNMLELRMKMPWDPMGGPI